MEFLSFTLNTDETFGIDIKILHEVIQTITPTRVPRQPQYMKGNISIRGNILPVIDLTVIMFPNIEIEKDFPLLIICEYNNIHIAIQAKSVEKINRINNEDIHSINNNDYILGIINDNGKLISLLNVEKIIQTLLEP